MAWGPQGEYKKTETPVTKAELEEDYRKHQWEPMREFINMIHYGDELLRVSEGDNHRGVTYLLCKRMVPPGTSVRDGTYIKITLVTSSMMS